MQHLMVCIINIYIYVCMYVYIYIYSGMLLYSILGFRALGFGVSGLGP